VPLRSLFILTQGARTYKRGDGDTKNKEEEVKECKSVREEGLGPWRVRAHPSLKDAKDGAPSSTLSCGVTGRTQGHGKE